MDQEAIPLAYHIIAGIIDVNGVVCNLFTLIFISFTRLGSRTATILFRTQCIFDGLTCLFAAISLFSPVHIDNFTGWFASFICHFWLSEYFLKFMELLNVSNLMWIAIDRFSAVYLGSRYKAFQKYEPFLCYTFILFHAIISPLPVIFAVDYNNGICEEARLIYNTSFDQFTVYSWLILAYLIPSIIMITCYSRVYYFIKQSLENSQSQKHSTCSVDVTKSDLNERRITGQQVSSITLSASVSTSALEPTSFSSIRKMKSILLSITLMCTLFVLSHSYYHIYSLASLYGAVQYQSISIQRRLSIFFTVIKSSLNPIILVVSSQHLRKKIVKLYYQLSYRIKYSRNSHPPPNITEASTKTSDDY
ncbi:unnamed protein product [Trichobilharzia regenti]|nr:unnamed protein product [Trichobilharzia regenti]